jgi:hypothetical protein
LRFDVVLGDRLPGPGPCSMSFALMNLTSDRRREDVPCSGGEIPAAPLGVSCSVLGMVKRSWSWSVMRNLGAGAGVGAAASVLVLTTSEIQ